MVHTFVMIHVHHLPIDTNLDDLVDLAGPYGRILHTEMKPPVHRTISASITFASHSEAADAMRGLQGRCFDGYWLETTLGATHSQPLPNRRKRTFEQEDGAQFRAKALREYRLLLSNIPRDTRWGELKQALQPIVRHIGYVNVRTPGEAIVAFHHKEDMECALEHCQRQPLNLGGEEVMVNCRIESQPKRVAYDPFAS